MKKLLLLPGDGIGPEVVGQARKVMQWLIDNGHCQVTLDEDLIGGASLVAHGTPLTDEVFAKAKAADAILLGCVGHPQWDFNEKHLRPGHGLLTLRKELGLYANLRPVQAFEPLYGHSSLKQATIESVDLLIVRELTGGIYFGEPRGRKQLPDGTVAGFNTMTYSVPEIERIARVAFELARTRRSKLCSVDKANVLETSELWRETVTALGREEFADVELSHMYVDNCAMQLVRKPSQFDVIVTENMFGDILSDCAAMVSGSLGLLASSSIGPKVGGLYSPSLYEPVHGSAPDIAGQGISNPYGTLLSLEMLLRMSLGYPQAADALRQAIEMSMREGVLTPDLAAKASSAHSTQQVGDFVVSCLQKSIRSMAGAAA